MAAADKASPFHAPPPPSFHTAHRNLGAEDKVFYTSIFWAS